MGHEVTPYISTCTLSMMVSTRSRARLTKQSEPGPTAPATLTPDLAAILEGQDKMLEELAGLRKRSADEMEALRQENSRLRRKIEADPTQKGKAKEASKAPKSPTYQPSEEESEYNPTPHTFTITQQTSIMSTHHTHTSNPPSRTHYSTYPRCHPSHYPYPTSQLYLHFSYPRPPSHSASLVTTPTTQASPPFH